MNPRVSILLPVYNGGKYLDAAIRSIVGQTFQNWELLVLDDGSTDGSLEVARAFPDERVRSLPNDENLGVAKTLNRAMAQARGEFIARMDADDEALPERLAKQVTFFEKNPQVGLLGTNALSAETGELTFAVPTEHEDIRCNLLFNCSFLHPTVMWRAAVFRENGLAYEEQPTAEDYDLWERACQKLQSANLREPLLRYRNDPEVKLTSYVCQQKMGGRNIRERALRRVGLNPTPEEMEIHHAVSYDNLPQPAVPLSEVDAWLKKILTANRKAQALAAEPLRQRLHLQRYYHLMRNRPKATIRQCFRAGREMGRVPLRLAVASAAKTLKESRIRRTAG